MKKAIAAALVVAAGLACGASTAKADFTFDTPTNLGPTVNTTSGEGGSGGLSISADGLSVYFDSNRSGGYGGADLLIATRATKNDDWSAAVNLGSVVNSSDQDCSPSISADGLSLYFSSNRAGAVGGSGWSAMDVWVAKRQTTTAHWGTPSNLGPVVNSVDADYMSYISADGLSLYLSSTRTGGLGLRDLWMTTRATTSNDWSEPVALGPSVNSSYNERRMCISSDGLILFFQSDRPRGIGFAEIWITARATTNDDWTEPVKLGPGVNVTSDISPIVSSDGRTLYFSSYNRDGGYGVWDLWQAPIIPIVDFNGDGEVDGKDVLALAQRWGVDDPVCDIGPMPWGDGTVDLQDLTALVEYIAKEVIDPTLVAHWPLDEAEGSVAHDSVADHDGTVVGSPVWQLAGGCVDGALELNGMTFVAADSVLDPASGPFSAFAWVKGGAPEQAIISQQTGANWLMADPVTGALMTELRSGGRQSRSLSSQTDITDGKWHRVGFAWDGSACMLYVDDVCVAEAAEDVLAGSPGKLVIGCGKTMTPTSFFTGLIDDVRIYNRAVRP